MKSWRFLRPAAWVLGGITVYGFGLFAFITVMNADFYGRLIETQPAGRAERTDQTDIPTARLVLRRLPSDENTVETSLIVMTEGGKLADAIRGGKVSITATVRDGSSYQPFGIGHSVTLDSETSRPQAGVFPLAVESGRFTLPALPSVYGFPFDDLTIRPIIDVRVNGQTTFDYRVQIQKALPGRIMSISRKDNTEVSLTRSSTEKALVIASSAVFLLLSVVLAYGMFVSPHGATTVEQLIGIGGYIIAAVGFRELLGVSRASGTSALEIGVIGIPLLVLTAGVAVSFIRGRRHLHRKTNVDASSPRATG